jgi:2-iminoacetate synthase
MNDAQFYPVAKHWTPACLADRLASVRETEVLRALEKNVRNELDFLALLSPQAVPHLETMARRSRNLTLANFGKVILLYSPLYLANICDNECVYCGFRHSNRITRRKLTLEEVEGEAQAIAATGIRHVLMLTGESRTATPVSYIADCVKLVQKHFASAALEIYPLSIQEYGTLVAAGADGLTLYQETYNEPLYGELHPKGPKNDYRWRLEAPGRACAAGMRGVGVGALLGLDEFRHDGFLAGLQAAWLQRTWPEVEVSVSLPRVQPQVGDFGPRFEVTDHNFVQLLLALRLFLPRAGISISTREQAAFRKNLIGLGPTRMSAGSRTEVGGYSLGAKSDGQFEIADTSSVQEIEAMIESCGYQPVFKDWQQM